MAFSASLCPRLTGLTPAGQQVPEYRLRAWCQPRFSDHLFRLGLSFYALLALCLVSIPRQPHSPCSKSNPPCLSQVLFWVMCSRRVQLGLPIAAKLSP